jgi:hypothetical protein
MACRIMAASSSSMSSERAVEWPVGADVVVGTAAAAAAAAGALATVAAAAACSCCCKDMAIRKSGLWQRTKQERLQIVDTGRRGRNAGSVERQSHVLDQVLLQRSSSHGQVRIRCGDDIGRRGLFKSRVHVHRVAVNLQSRKGPIQPVNVERCDPSETQSQTAHLIQTLPHDAWLVSKADVGH